MILMARPRFEYVRVPEIERPHLCIRAEERATHTVRNIAKHACKEKRWTRMEVRDKMLR